MKRLLLLFSLIAFGCHYSQSSEEDPIVAIQIQDRNGLTETISSPDRLVVYNGINFFDSQPYKKVLRVYKKDGKNHSKITTYHPNGAVWQYLEAQEMRANGAYREWFQNGLLKIEAFLVGGPADLSPGAQQDWLFEGLSQVWDEQGNLVAKIPYKNGVLEGISLYFYPNGQIEREVPFHQNLLHGIGLEFYPDGKLKSKISYEAGMKNGSSLGFFSENQPAWVEDHAEGLIRSASYYTPNGELIASVENGGGRQALYENNLLAYLVEIRKGRPEGRIEKYAPNGEVLSFFFLKNGNKQGEEVEFYLSSERTDSETTRLPKISLNWHENEIHGVVKTWYNNGQMQSQREYLRRLNRFR